MFQPTIFKPVNDYFAKRRMMLQLRRLSDRQLIDCGISPALLESGIAAYPWRELADPAGLRFDTTAAARLKTTVATAFSAGEVARGIAELQSCSDSELRDLGVTRGSIREAVEYGRPGIDRGIDQASEPKAA